MLYSMLHSRGRVVLKIRVTFGVLFIRVPHYFGELKKGPELREQPHKLLLTLSPKP